MKKTTQAEIGRMLGISSAAVGAALNGSQAVRVSDKTRKQVQALAEKLGYRPLRAAQVLKRGKSGLIGMIQFSGISLLSLQKMEEVTSTLLEYGYQLIIEEISITSADISRAWENLHRQAVEGVILENAPQDINPSIVAEIEKTGFPTVAISGGGAPCIPQIRPDVIHGMEKLTAYALDKGARRLLLSLPSIRPSWTAQERIEGFTRAITQCGGMVARISLETKPTAKILRKIESHRGPVGIIGESPLPYDAQWFRLGYRSGVILLESWYRADTIFCSNDQWAFGLLRACAEKGLNVPEDIRIAGFDGEPFSAYGTVPLTTVAQPVSALVAEAIRLLLKQIRKEPLSPAEYMVKLPNILQARASC